jgi:FkbM family methyltransferase
MYKFKISPERKKSYFGQTDWLGYYYNIIFQGKKDGFLVEIGVGHTFDWNIMGTPKILDNHEKFIRGESTTIELLENGWFGIYIEPIEEFLTLELTPLLKNLIGDENMYKVKMAPFAASDTDGFLEINSIQTLSLIEYSNKSEQLIPYNYEGRIIEKRNTTKILQENYCPQFVDMLSIDVEGHELNVLKGIDFNYYEFKMILIEIDKTPLTEIMEIIPKKYEILYEDELNALLILK